MSFAVRSSRFSHMCHALLRFPHLSFIPPVPYPPLRGTSFHRKEGSSTRAPFLGRGCRAQRGEIGFLFGRRSRLLFAFPVWKRGPRSDALIYDALETIFSLSFIPLVPYPARFARHLPHAGKALSVVILFSTYACIRSDNARKAAFSYRRSLPPWGRLCRGYCFSTHACIRSDDMGIALLSQTAYLRRSFPLFFIPLPHPTSASSGHLPLEGKALYRGQRHSRKWRT